MNEILREKISESLSAVVPITMIVLALSVFVVPLETGTMAMFVVGAVMLIFGMALFQLGAETAMTPLGEGIGVQLTKINKYIAETYSDRVYLYIRRSCNFLAC